MQVIYALEPFPMQVEKTIFLAGPTPRGDATSWRSEAIQLLKDMGYDGHVFVPEPKNGFWAENYIHQVEWEDEFLRAADVIAFWVPRDMKGTHGEGNGSPMPALTTNDEWGVWKNSGKVVWGAPDWADHVSYQNYHAKKLKVPQAKSLRETLRLAVEKVGEGSIRKGAAAKVPSFVWKRSEFRSWYNLQLANGNTVSNLKVEWTFWGSKQYLYLYAIRSAIEVAEEGRTKADEIVLFRSDIASVCLYKLAEPLIDSKIVLVREFRQSIRNEESFVYELPGGSSHEEGTSPRNTAVEEVSEEVGLTITPDRFKALGSRQMGATLTGYIAHLFAVELTEAELKKLEGDETTHGATATERTYVHVVTLREVLQDSLVDWPTLGMIFGAFNQ